MASRDEKDNSAYTYTLFVSGDGNESIHVTGRLPQQFLVSVGSTWDGNAAGDTAKELGQNVGGVVGLAATANSNIGGNNIGFTALANRQWSGGMPLTFNLLAEFNAIDNAIEDVIKPVVLLQSMSMPTALSELSAFGISAGNVIGAPYFDNLTASGGNVGGKSKIVLRLGDMFVFEDMIVENVSLTQDMRLTQPGLPIKISAEIQVATRGPITFEQYVSYMKGNAMKELFNGSNTRISLAKSTGPGSAAGYSQLEQVAPNK